MMIFVITHTHFAKVRYGFFDPGNSMSYSRTVTEIRCRSLYSHLIVTVSKRAA